jgi:RNA polymerase sigma-70 factor (ECF subfamily)
MGIESDHSETYSLDELLARARAGEGQAFCQLAAQHEARLFQQACGLIHDSSAAEDLVSETLVEAWRSLPRFNGSCRFSTWLFSILLHRYQKYLRRARSRPVPFASLPPLEAAQHRQAQENLPAAERTPAEEVMSREAAGQLREAIAALGAAHQQVLLLRFFEGASLQETAALLGCSLGTVKSRLHYGLEKLREAQHRLNLSELWRDT